jgi:hypothetical protein
VDDLNALSNDHRNHAISVKGKMLHTKGRIAPSATPFLFFTRLCETHEGTNKLSTQARSCTLRPRARRGKRKRCILVAAVALHCSRGAAGVTAIRHLCSCRSRGTWKHDAVTKLPTCKLPNFRFYFFPWQCSSIKLLRNFVTTTARALQFLHLYY